jgi:hypothetical protein
VTVAVLSLKEISTWLTPGTAARLPFTMCGQAERVMFSTASVTVFSAAKDAVLFLVRSVSVSHMATMGES